MASVGPQRHREKEKVFACGIAYHVLQPDIQPGL